MTLNTQFLDETMSLNYMQRSQSDQSATYDEIAPMDMDTKPISKIEENTSIVNSERNFMGKFTMMDSPPGIDSTVSPSDMEEGALMARIDELHIRSENAMKQTNVRQSPLKAKKMNKSMSSQLQIAKV